MDRSTREHHRSHRRELDYFEFGNEDTIHPLESAQGACRPYNKFQKNILNVYGQF